MRLLLSVAFFCLLFSANAQSFLNPVEPSDVMSKAFMKSATVVYPGGEEVVGEKFGMMILTNGAISNFVLKTADGQKLKLKAGFKI